MHLGSPPLRSALSSSGGHGKHHRPNFAGNSERWSLGRDRVGNLDQHPDRNIEYLGRRRAGHDGLRFGNAAERKRLCQPSLFWRHDQPLNTSIYADDFRVWDTTGSYQNAPVGIDSRIITKLPSGAGSVTAWTPNGASQNWQCVDENPPDGGTTYVSASTAGNQDSYAMPVASFTIAPVMVLARALMRKDDRATRTAGVGVVSGFSGATEITATIGSSYGFVDGCISIDPSTGLVWTASGADAALHLKTEVS